MRQHPIVYLAFQFIRILTETREPLDINNTNCHDSKKAFVCCMYDSTNISMRLDFSVWYLTINVQCARATPFGLWYLDYVQFSGILYIYQIYIYIFWYLVYNRFSINSVAPQSMLVLVNCMTQSRPASALLVTSVLHGSSSLSSHNRKPAEGRRHTWD